MRLMATGAIFLCWRVRRPLIQQLGNLCVTIQAESWRFVEQQLVDLSGMRVMAAGAISVRNRFMLTDHLGRVTRHIRVTTGAKLSCFRDQQTFMIGSMRCMADVALLLAERRMDNRIGAVGHQGAVAFAA